MRVSDDRYDRDRLRFDLALRMMRHGARPRTICAWTGLTDDRLRKLCRAYVVRRGIRPVYRVRTKLPQDVGNFLKFASLGFEASSLACVFYLLGLLTDEPHSLNRAEMFCQAYEMHLAIYPPARLSFEQAWFLLTALVRNAGIKLNLCGQCGRFYLSDPVRIDLSSCGCGGRRFSLPRRRTTGARTRAQSRPRSTNEVQCPSPTTR